MTGPDLSPATSGKVAVLVPVKGFGDAKKRLRSHLSQTQRARLARHMAERVVAAADPLPVFVVCDDHDVRDWAGSVEAVALWSPGRGLNGAVTRGVISVAGAGFTRVIVAHADLPLATSLAWLGDDAHSDATVVPDRHDDGTNVISIPSASGFRFQYGPNSCAKHVAEARRLGMTVRVAKDVALGWDVDVPADLEIPPDLASGVDLHLFPLGDPCP